MPDVTGELRTVGRWPCGLEKENRKVVHRSLPKKAPGEQDRRRKPRRPLQRARDRPPTPSRHPRIQFLATVVDSGGLVVSPPSAGDHFAQLRTGGWRMRERWLFRGPFSAPGSYLLARRRRGAPRTMGQTPVLQTLPRSRPGTTFCRSSGHLSSPGGRSRSTCATLTLGEWRRPRS